MVTSGGCDECEAGIVVELPPGEGAVSGTVPGNELVLVDSEDFVVVGLVVPVDRVVVDTIGESDLSEPHPATPAKARAAATEAMASGRARITDLTERPLTRSHPLNTVPAARAG